MKSTEHASSGNLFGDAKSIEERSAQKKQKAIKKKSTHLVNL